MTRRRVHLIDGPAAGADRRYPDENMSSPSTLIAETIEKLDDELIELRRDLHAHPELSWSEVRTTERIATRLEEAGCGSGGCRAAA